MIYPPTSEFLYRQEVLRDRPVVYWPLDRTSFAYDYRPAISPLQSLSHGTQNLTPGPFPGTAANYFDASTNYYGIPYAGAGALNTDPFTIECWAYATSNVTAQQVNAVVANLGGTGGWRLYNWGWQTGSPWTFSANQWFALVAGTPFVPYRWYHLVGQIQTIVPYSSGIANFFVNGKIDQTTGLPMFDNTSGDWCVGNTVNSSTAGSMFPGGIAHVAQYSYMLPAARVAAHYRVGIGLLRNARIQSMRTRGSIVMAFH